MTIESEKIFTFIVKSTVIFVLFLTIPINVYLHAQEQRHFTQCSVDLCNQPHTNKSSLTTTTKSWANISAPNHSEIHYSDFGSAPKRTKLFLTIPINVYLHAQEQRHFTHCSVDLCTPHTNDSPSIVLSWANISAPNRSENNYSDLGAL